MRRLTIVLFLLLLLILIGCQSNESSTVSDRNISNIVSETERSSESITPGSNDSVADQSNTSDDVISTDINNSIDISPDITDTDTSYEQNSSSVSESSESNDESSIPQEPSEEETSEPVKTEDNKPESSEPNESEIEVSEPSEESKEESVVPETSEGESSIPESSEESDDESSIPEESDLSQPDIPDIPEVSSLPEEYSSSDTSESVDVLLTEQDHNRIMTEVIEYAESYSEKGFEFDWNESMTFGWDVGFMGTPRVKYDGIDGVIKTLKHHIDLIYQTSTNPMYGLTTTYMTYKVEQIIVDGDIAYVVIYGG